MDEEKKENHESFGMLSFSRISSSQGENLFGSAIPHRQTIIMKVRRAEKVRRLHEERYYAREQLIEVEMSPMQFAECITALNMGDGIPCTIRHIGRERMEDCPETTFRQQFEAEFKETSAEVNQEVSKMLKTMRELLSKKALTKADRQEVINGLDLVSRHLLSNLPFIASQFNEAMDKVVTDARSSVEAFFLHRLTELGKQQLSEDLGNRKDLPLAIIFGEEHENSTD